MAKTRNRGLALAQQLWVTLRRERPEDLHRRLLADLGSQPLGGRLAPRDAWRLFKRHAEFRSFCSNGWLTQFGVYEFNGPSQFHFSLVRQFDVLDPHSDEYKQLEIVLYNEPTRELKSLGSWNLWSFEFPTLGKYFEAVEANPLFQRILFDQGEPWTFEIVLEET